MDRPIKIGKPIDLKAGHVVQVTVTRNQLTIETEVGNGKVRIRVWDAAGVEIKQMGAKA